MKLVTALKAVALALVFARPAWALDPNELLLIVNSNEKAGTELADYYAKARHVPDGRIVSLDLPNADSMSFKQYEEQVAPAVREFLKTNRLEEQVKCLVTFYGVPLRIENRVNTSEENQELLEMRHELIGMADRFKPPVVKLESFVRDLEPAYVPPTGDDLEHLGGRVQAAVKAFYDQLNSIPDENKNKKLEVLIGFADALRPFTGDPAELERMAADLNLHPEKQAASLPAFQERQKSVVAFRVQLAEAEQKRYDAAARKTIRNVTEDHFGLLAHLHAVQDQVDYLDGNQSGSAFDSDLALVMWPVYVRTKWTTNPLNLSVIPANGVIPTNKFPTYMVARIDGPTTEIAKSLIDTAIQVETDGLKGKVVIDSLGVMPGQEPHDQPGYGIYDQYLRNLAKLIQTKTQIPVTLEATQSLIPPGAEKDVAIYCGWHSAGQYVNSCAYNNGAIAYHIASFELSSLRAPGNNGWVRGLLSNKVISTLGPVEEPFLGAFPRPDEYFPLAMTGKLTMAEVYWKTVPWISWKIAYVGDPLYTPYKANPALKASDLPFYLRASLPKAAPAH